MSISHGKNICCSNGQIEQKSIFGKSLKTFLLLFFIFIYFFKFSTQIAYCCQALILCGFSSAWLLIANNNYMYSCERNRKTKLKIIIVFTWLWILFLCVSERFWLVYGFVVVGMKIDLVVCSPNYPFLIGWLKTCV